MLRRQVHALRSVALKVLRIEVRVTILARLVRIHLAVGIVVQLKVALAQPQTNQPFKNEGVSLERLYVRLRCLFTGGSRAQLVVQFKFVVLVARHGKALRISIGRTIAHQLLQELSFTSLLAKGVSLKHRKVGWCNREVTKSRKCRSSL